MLYMHSTKMYLKPVPAVIWSVHPISQIITVRPAWDPYSKFILPKELDSYFLPGHFYALGKLLKETRFYPYEAKFVQIARNILAYFRQGKFIYVGQNVVIDPWFNNAEKIAAINYYDPFQESKDLPRFYGRK